MLHWEIGGKVFGDSNGRERITNTPHKVVLCREVKDLLHGQSKSFSNRAAGNNEKERGQEELTNSQLKLIQKSLL